MLSARDVQVACIPQLPLQHPLQLLWVSAVTVTRCAMEIVITHIVLVVLFVVLWGVSAVTVIQCAMETAITHIVPVVLFVVMLLL